VKKGFPHYRQLDAVDCGPTCLRMIAKFYGKNYTLEYLREKTFITQTGVSLAGISDGAKAIGFRTKAVKIPLKILLEEAPKPCIVYWRQRHFVVVHQVTKTHVLVADPALGLEKYTHKEFSDGWLNGNYPDETPGIVLLLEVTQQFHEEEGDNSEGLTLNYFWNYLKPYKRFFIQVGVGMLLGAVLSFIFPFLTQAVVDRGIEYQDMNFIYLILFGQLALFFGQMIANFIQNWILMLISNRVNISLVSDFLAKLMRLPISFFETRNQGDILQRISDHSIIQDFLTSSSLGVIFSVFNMLVFGVILAIFSMPIFTVFVVSMILYFFWIYAFLKYRRRINLRRFDRLADNQSALVELVSGMNEIKLQNIEDQKRWKWENIQARLFKIGIEDLKLSQYQETGAFFITHLKDILITFLAAKGVVDGNITFGTMLSIQGIVGQANAPLGTLLDFVHKAQDARISLDRLNEIHKKEDENPIDVPRTAQFSYYRDIIFQNLSFSYGGPSSMPVLKNINLVLSEGKVTALVGSSGSGKTTILKLLLKFYDPTGGNIFIGNRKLQDYHTAWWRTQCGVVMQDGFIFSDTIERNIVGSDEITDADRLNYAVYAANIFDIIESLPMGLSTKIGGEGKGLSIGQKQRVLIARAIYKNPPFLFFDEATSALDANNEKFIMENLSQFYQGRTVLVIAHRLSTVRNADNIVVLHQGEIVEEGKHQDLVAKQGYYYELVKNQLELGN
jgi:ATP-binding cassette subfamily B protein